MCFVIYITPKITNSSLGYTLSVSTKKSVTASETRIPVIWALGRHLYGWGRVYYWLVKLNLLGLTAIWHMMIQCTTNTECDSGLTFFISHFRRCYSDKSVMPGGTFFFFHLLPPQREVSPQQHPWSWKGSCSWVQPAVCVHASQHRDMNPALQVVNNCSLHPGRLLPVTGKERIKIR